MWSSQNSLRFTNTDFTYWNYPFQCYCDPTDANEDLCVQQLTIELEQLMAVAGVDPAFPRRLRRLLQRSRELEDLHIASLMSLLGCRLNGLAFHQEAELLHRRALVIGIRSLGSDHPDLVTSMEWLAYSLFKQRHFKEAVLLCFSTIVLLHEVEGQFHPKIANCYYNLAMIVEAMGLFDHAHVLRAKGFTLLTLLYPHLYHYWWSSLTSLKNPEFYSISPKQDYWNYHGTGFCPPEISSYGTDFQQKGGDSEDLSFLYVNGRIATY